MADDDDDGEESIDKNLVTARELAERAMVADKAGQRDEAKRLYGEALQWFGYILRTEKNETMRGKVAYLVKSYLDRYEELSGNGRTNSTNTTNTADQQPTTNGDNNDNDVGETISKTDNPNVSLDDIIGNEEAKKALNDALVYPRMFPQFYTEKTGMKAPSSILFFGPPGTGKTKLAKAAATIHGGAFYDIKCSDLLSRWVGGTEKRIEGMLRTATESAPSVIFMDEIEAFMRSRGSDEQESSTRMKSQLLKQLEGLPRDVMLIGATNLPDQLDPAFRRRFEKLVYVALPNVAERVRILELYLGKCEHALTGEHLAGIANRTPLYSGADLEKLVKEAMGVRMHETMKGKYFRYNGKKVESATPCDDCILVSSPNTCKSCGCMRGSIGDFKHEDVILRRVTVGDFEVALKSSKPTSSAEEIARYDKFTKKS